MSTAYPTFSSLAIRTAVAHTVSYMLMGMFAATLLDYEAAFARPYMACWMRQFTDPVIVLGPVFQPLRGIVFALAIHPVREVIFGRAHGWLVLWWLLVALGIVATFGPAPGSLEGLVFTVIPPRDQLRGYLEVVPQAGLLAFLVVYWIEHPHKRWLTWVLAALFVLALGLPLLGLLARRA